MKCGRQSEIETWVKANWFPEWAGKLLAAIGYDIAWYGGLADKVLEKHPCQLWGVNIFPAGQVNCHFCQLIDHYQDCDITGDR
jgi:hypothetical protein